MKPLIIFVFTCMMFVACNNANKPVIAKMPPLPPPPIPEKEKPLPTQKQTDSVKKHRVIMAIDKFLSHKNGGFKCDSAIILAYKLKPSKDVYMPLTKEGDWIPDIIKRKKLTYQQLRFINSIFGDKKTFTKDRFACFAPRVGFVYFKNGEVIGQSCLCLDCAGIESTAKLGNNDSFGAIGGTGAWQKLFLFYNSLKM